MCYRQEENKAAYTMEDNSLDHGNFFGTHHFTRECALKEHLSEVIEKRKQLNESASGSRGRGSLVYFLNQLLTQ